VAHDDMRLDLAANPRLLNPVRALVRSYLLANGFPPEQADLVVLAVDEACANSIRHSYGGQEGRIVLTLRKSSEHLEFILRDEGVPAEPDKCVKKESPPPDIESLRPGGLGVQLMHRVFDEVRFEPGSNRGNCVTMRLRRPETQGKGARRAQDA